MIYTVTFSPTLDYVVGIDKFRTGMINRTSSEKIYPGGKGVNVSIALKNFGYENTAMGFIAGFTGAEIKRLLHGIGVQNNFINVEKGMSRINLKIISEEETAINGQGPEISPEDIGILYARLRCLVDDDILVLAGHIPDTLPSNMYEQVLELLAGRNLKVVVDAEKDLLEGTLKYRPWLIKPNREELGGIFGVEIRGREDAVPYARKLQAGDSVVSDIQKKRITKKPPKLSFISRAGSRARGSSRYTTRGHRPVWLSVCLCRP